MSLQFRILDYNYAWLSNTNLTYSSQDSEFPASNLQTQIRSKVWRSSGNFEIAAGYKIDFQKVLAGAQLTATVTAATYTPTTLAAHLKSILEAADAVNTYTVTYSTATGLWTIASSGAYLKILWNSGTNTAVSFGPTIGFSTAADSDGAVSYTGSTIAIHTGEWVVFDTLTPQNIDSFAMFADAMRGYQFSTNAVIKIQANATNVWTAPAISVTLTPNSTYNVASKFWTSPNSYRYWRLFIVDPANTNLYVEVGKCVLALATQFTHVPSNGMSVTLDDQSVISRNQYGHEYTDKYPIKAMISLDHAALAYTDIEALHAIYLRVGRQYPIVFAIDPTENMFVKDEFLIFGKFMSAINPQQVTRDVFSQSIDIQEVF